MSLTSLRKPRLWTLALLSLAATLLLSSCSDWGSYRSNYPIDVKHYFDHAEFIFYVRDDDENIVETTEKTINNIDDMLNFHNLASKLRYGVKGDGIPQSDITTCGIVYYYMWRTEPYKKPEKNEERHLVRETAVKFMPDGRAWAVFDRIANTSIYTAVECVDLFDEFLRIVNLPNDNDNNNIT